MARGHTAIPFSAAAVNAVHEESEKVSLSLQHGIYQISLSCYKIGECCPVSCEKLRRGV
jgi:hypothetical protein